MFGLPEGRQRRVEIAAVSGTASAQGKRFPKQELRGYVHKVQVNRENEKFHLWLISANENGQNS